MTRSDPFQLVDDREAPEQGDAAVHVFGNRIVCDTEARGYARPRNRTPLEIVVDASQGFIPLWAADTTLRWRFQERSLRRFVNPEAAKAAISALMGDALLAWGSARPIAFSQRDDAWDFEVVMRHIDDCDANGCVLASAFFPDGGRHQVVIYPRMFAQSHKEQVDTLIHEIGHIFGLRHFFANISETAWPSRVFGVHKPFTIMNYGSQSELTQDDRNDLQRLYQMAWTGQLRAINGTPIRLMQPFSATASSPFLIGMGPPLSTAAAPAIPPWAPGARTESNGAFGPADLEDLSPGFADDAEQTATLDEAADDDRFPRSAASDVPEAPLADRIRQRKRG